MVCNGCSIRCKGVDIDNDNDDELELCKLGSIRRSLCER